MAKILISTSPQKAALVAYNKYMAWNSSNASKLPTGSSARTLSFWFKDIGTQWDYSILGYGTASTAALFEVIYKSYGLAIHFHGTTTTFTTDKIPRNKPVFISIVYAGNSLNFGLYVNGEYVATASNTTIINTADNGVVVGRSNYNITATSNGHLVTEIQLWSEARTAEHLKEDMKGLTSPGTLPTLKFYSKLTQGSVSDLSNNSLPLITNNPISYNYMGPISVKGNDRRILLSKSNGRKLHLNGVNQNAKIQMNNCKAMSFWVKRKPTAYVGASYLFDTRMTTNPGGTSAGGYWYSTSLNNVVVRVNNIEIQNIVEAFAQLPLVWAHVYVEFAGPQTGVARLGSRISDNERGEFRFENIRLHSNVLTEQERVDLYANTITEAIELKTSSHYNFNTLADSKTSNILDTNGTIGGSDGSSNNSLERRILK
jgi:hypothetical protein